MAALLISCKLLAVAATVGAMVWRWRRGPNGAFLANVLLLGSATSLWNLASIRFTLAGPSLGWAAVTCTAISGSAAAGFLVSAQITGTVPATGMAAPQARIVRAALVAIPAFVLIFLLTGIGFDSQNPGDYRSGLPFILTVGYGMALVITSLLLLARRFRDHDTLVRRAMTFFQGIIAVIAVTELRNLNVASIFASIAALAVLWLSRDEERWRAPAAAEQDSRAPDMPDSRVLIFKADGRLVAWNEDAAALLEQAGRQPLVGQHASELLGIDVPFIGRQRIAFGTANGDFVTSGYTTQSPTLRADGGQWIVLLRLVTGPDETTTTPADPLLEVDHRDEVTGMLGRAAIIERLRRTFAAREHVAVIRVDAVGEFHSAGGTDPALRNLAQAIKQVRVGVVVGRIERLTFIALIPDPTEASELSARVRARFDDFEDEHGTSLAVTAIVSNKGESCEEFTQRVLTSPEIVERVKWQPRWY